MSRARYYLDHNATTPLDPAVFAAMEPYLRGPVLGNPSSLHTEGRRARGAMDESRDKLAQWLGVGASQIIFTSGGTESCNLGVTGLALAAVESSGKSRHIVTSATEHSAVQQSCEILARRHGFTIDSLPVDSLGRTDPAALAAALRPDTALVSIMSANNETGVRQPMADLGRICAENRILFHSDVVQTAGKEPLPWKEWNLTSMSFTAHKFGGPTGAGALWLKAGIPVQRLLEGGSHENERRPGTENTAAIVGLAEAAVRSLQPEGGWEARESRRFALVELLWRTLADALPAGQIRRNGHPVERISNTLNISLFGLNSEELLIGLDLAGLAVSSGSACLVGSVRHSHVLEAMGISATEDSATVRFSLGNDLTEDDIREITRRVAEVAVHQHGVRARLAARRAAFQTVNA
ncbi:MAG: cysteine desulfurase family protein [Candidatus Methylacidiphilales bacterium]|nr:cysteine desulfurase family protein [Candidatus Methylacidiphilales bacterium]